MNQLIGLATSRNIMAELLTNGLRNDHTTYWNEKNKKDGVGDERSLNFSE